MVVIGSQDWVIEKLSRHRRSLREIPEAALETYNKIDPALRLPWNARTIANVMNSFIIDEARKAFDGQSGSKFLEANGTTYHLINECVLWYKQLDTDGLPSSYPTDTAQVLMQGSFPFLPKRFLLVVGFRFDEAMQKVERVEIQRFNSIGEIQFYIELEKTASATRVITMPPGASTTKTKTRVAIKRGPEQKELISGDE
jgi:hypothetical protein